MARLNYVYLMVRKSTKTLTATEFDQLRQHLRGLKVWSVDIARKHLVEGRFKTEIAEQYGITKKAVSQIIGRVWDVFITKGERPPGWVSFEVCLPPDMADGVKQMQRAALMHQRKGQR